MPTDRYIGGVSTHIGRRGALFRVIVVVTYVMTKRWQHNLCWPPYIIEFLICESEFLSTKRHFAFVLTGKWKVGC